MVKYLWVFFFFVFCVSCGEQEDIVENEEPLLPSAGTPWDYQFEKILPFLKDTAGFDKESFCKEGTWLAYVKNEKLWMGLFGNDFTGLIGEWNSSFELPKETKGLKICHIVKVNTGYIFFVHVYNTREVSQTSGITSFLLYLIDGSIELIHHFKDDFDKASVFDFRWETYGDKLLFTFYDNPGGKQYGYLYFNGGVKASQATVVKDKNSYFFTGLKDKKLKIYVCDEESGITDSWSGDTSIDLNLTIHEGYGGYKTYEVDLVRLEDILTMRWGYVANLAFLSRNQEIKKDVLILNDQNGINRYEETDSDPYSDIRFYKWYDESILFYNMYTDSCLVVSSTGKDIKEFYSSRLYEKLASVNYESISYEEAIFLSRDWDLSRFDLSRSESKWISPIRILKENMQRNAQVTVSIENKSGNLWEYKCDILYYEGNKKQVRFSVDIETGEVFP